MWRMCLAQVPCKYDSEKRMYVPTGGRDVVPGGKVGTREKTAEDLQALDVGESDEVSAVRSALSGDVLRFTADIFSLFLIPCRLLAFRILHVMLVRALACTCSLSHTRMPAYRIGFVHCGGKSSWTSAKIPRDSRTPKSE